MAKQETRTALVGDVESWMDEGVLHRAFSPAGFVTNIEIVRGANNANGFAFIEFNDPASVSTLVGKSGDARRYQALGFNFPVNSVQFSVGDVNRKQSQDHSAAAPAAVRPAQTGPEIEVWADNVEDEVRNMSDLAETYSCVAIEVDFCTMLSPTGPFDTHLAYNYSMIKWNVDLGRALNISFSLSDATGQRPEGVSTWRFNFLLDLLDPQIDFLAQEFLEKMVSSERLKQHFSQALGCCLCVGIKCEDFGALLLGTGMVLTEETQYITFSCESRLSESPFKGGLCDPPERRWTVWRFNGLYCFGYLLRILKSQLLPGNPKEFFEALDRYFPWRFDLAQHPELLQHLCQCDQQDPLRRPLFCFAPACLDAYHRLPEVVVAPAPATGDVVVRTVIGGDINTITRGHQLPNPTLLEAQAERQREREEARRVQKEKRAEEEARRREEDEQRRREDEQRRREEDDWRSGPKRDGGQPYQAPRQLREDGGGRYQAPRGEGWWLQAPRSEGGGRRRQNAISRANNDDWRRRDAPARNPPREDGGQRNQAARQSREDGGQRYQAPRGEDGGGRYHQAPRTEDGGRRRQNAISRANNDDDWRRRDGGGRYHQAPRTEDGGQRYRAPRGEDGGGRYHQAPRSEDGPQRYQAPSRRGAPRHGRWYW
eukprot:symbB.v1.2.032678.t1/scaffold3946.1/size47719/2